MVLDTDQYMFRVVDDGGESGNMTIGSGATFETTGQELLVDGAIDITGTLDANVGGDARVAADSITINVGGTYDGSDEITAVTNLINNGTYNANGGTLHYATNYTWTGAVDGDWEDQGNWNSGDGSPGDDGYPDGPLDRAFVPAAIPDTITLSGAITVDKLEFQPSCIATVLCGGTFTADDSLSFGTVVINDSSATFRCRGHDLDVDGELIILGTLDAHTDGDPSVTVGEELTLDVGGVYSATRGTTQAGNSLYLFGTLTHNGGTVLMDSSVTCYLQYGHDDYKPRFHDLIIDGMSVHPANNNYDQNEDIFIEHSLIITNGGTFLHRNTRGMGTWIYFGTTTNSATIENDGTYDFYENGGSRQPKIYAATNTYPVIVTGNDFLWNNGGSATVDTEVNLKWVDYRIDLSTEGDTKGVFIRLDGDCTFQNVTIKTSDTIIAQDYNHALEDLTIEAGGTWTNASCTNTVSGDFDNSGTNHAGTSTMIFTGAGKNVDNNNQAFYNVTANPGGGNLVTLEAGKVSAVQNLLRAQSGTCHTDDKIDQNPVVNGTWSRLGGGVNTIACGVPPQIDLNATLETGDPPPFGTVVIIR